MVLALEIPFRLSGALRIIDVAKAVLPRGVEAGRITPDAWEYFGREFARLVLFVETQEIYSPAEFKVIVAKIEMVAGLIEGLSDLFTLEEKALYAEGQHRFSGMALGKVGEK